FSALIWPVSTTVSPVPPLAAVMVRTGRASAALALVFCSQPPSANAGTNSRLSITVLIAFCRKKCRATAQLSVSLEATGRCTSSGGDGIPPTAGPGLGDFERLGRFRRVGSYVEVRSAQRERGREHVRRALRHVPRDAARRSQGRAIGRRREGMD